MTHVQACVRESVRRSDLRVSHAGGCNESLLQSFALQSAVLLASLGTPFQIQQVLDNLRVSTQSGVDQRGLAALVNVVDLEDVQREAVTSAETKGTEATERTKLQDSWYRGCLKVLV